MCVNIPSWLAVHYVGQAGLKFTEILLPLLSKQNPGIKGFMHHHAWSLNAFRNRQG